MTDTLKLCEYNNKKVGLFNMRGIAFFWRPAPSGLLWNCSHLPSMIASNLKSGRQWLRMKDEKTNLQ